MAKFKPPPPAPPAPLWKRAWTFAQTPLGATIIGGLIVGVILILVFGQSDSSNPASSRPGARPVQAQPEPDDATEQVAQRPIWTAEPTTYPGASDNPEGVATDPVELDLLVGSPKEIFENPEFFEGRSFFIVGRLATEQTITGPFYDREFRLVTGEPGFDAYVGTVGSYASVSTGEVVTALGRLAATGETRLPGGGPRRSIYLLSTYEENGGEVDSVILTPSSGNLRRAIKRVRGSAG